MIRVLGFCGSPRLGNSLYLLEQALEAVRRRAEELGEEVELDTCSIRGKKLSGCVMCQGCMRDGTCLEVIGVSRRVGGTRARTSLKADIPRLTVVQVNIPATDKIKDAQYEKEVDLILYPGRNVASRHYEFHC